MVDHTPNLTCDVAIDALYTSALKVMSAFAENPSAELARSAVQLLNALACHPARFSATTGHDVFGPVMERWKSIEADLRLAQRDAYSSALH